MPIPTTRAELTELVETSFSKLRAAIEEGGDELGSVRCIANWSVHDLLAVRLWWTESVVQWIAAGRRGETPAIPAPGYGWKDTPRLNDDVVATARGTSYRAIRTRLTRGVQRVLATIDDLDDTELLEVGVFPLGGPVARRTLDLVEHGTSVHDGWDVPAPDAPAFKVVKRRGRARLRQPSPGSPRLWPSRIPTP